MSISKAASPEKHNLPLVLVLVGFLAFYTPFFIKYGFDYKNPSIDLPSFYTASISVFVNGDTPYDPSLLNSMHNEIVYPYLYPPPSLLLFYPLAQISYPAAKTLVLILNHILLILLAWQIPSLWFSMKLKQDTAFYLLWFFFVFTFFPAASTIIHGQFNFLLLEFILLYVILARKGQIFWAAFFLALAVILKTYPFLIVSALFMVGRRRDGTYTIAWLAAITLLAWLIFPNKIWAEWLLQVLPTGGYASIPDGLFSPAVIWNQGLNGFFARQFRIRDEFSLASQFLNAKLWTYTSALLVLAITAITVWRDKNHPNQPSRVVLAALPAIYLVAPFSWEHHLVYLLPIIPFLYINGCTLNMPSRIAFYTFFAVCAITLSVEYFVSFKFFAALLIWALVLFVISKKQTN